MFIVMGIYIGSNEIQEIYVGEGIKSYEAMRGPCPEGFHIPTGSEMVAIKTAMTNLGISTSNGDTAKTYLKMPYAGFRDYTSGSTAGGGGVYWTCEASSSQYSRYLLISSSMFSVNTWYNGSGYSIRPFKDDAVVPDSGWTTLYTGTGTAGIFHNSTLGLISISSDGTTRITISDKNLGATTVYNSGDTLSQSNCGNFYQRGNNYGFPYTGTVTTSSTKVDTTGYGPGNYYSSSTFVTANTSSWINGTNNNLRGGTTGMTKKGNVIEVYVGTTKVRPTTPLTPPAEFTDWDDDVWDYVRQSFIETGDTEAAIEYMFGSDISFTIQDDLGTDLSDWEFSPIMPFYPDNTSWYGLQISNGGDMIDKHLVPEIPGYAQSICIIRDNDNLNDAEYIVGTYDSSDEGFDYQLSSLASHFSGKDTVCMFIFLM